MSFQFVCKASVVWTLIYATFPHKNIWSPVDVIVTDEKWLFMISHCLYLLDKHAFGATPLTSGYHKLIFFFQVISECGIVWFSLWCFLPYQKPCHIKHYWFYHLSKHTTETYFRYVSLWSIEISKNIKVFITPSLLCSGIWTTPNLSPRVKRRRY
jgi:hypothetical protein